MGFLNRIKRTVFGARETTSEPAPGLQADSAPHTPPSAAKSAPGVSLETSNLASTQVTRGDVTEDEPDWAPPVVRRRRVEPDNLRVLDLSALDSVRMRIKGSAYTVSDSERVRYGGPEYYLIREPDNEVDRTAVAVYGVRGHRVGYVAASRAASLSPLLERLDADAFKVSGAGSVGGSIVLWVDIPRVGELRRFVRDAVKLETDQER